MGHSKLCDVCPLTPCPVRPAKCCLRACLSGVTNPLHQIQQKRCDSDMNGRQDNIRTCETGAGAVQPFLFCSFWGMTDDRPRIQCAIGFRHTFRMTPFGKQAKFLRGISKRAYLTNLWLGRYCLTLPLFQPTAPPK